MVDRAGFILRATSAAALGDTPAYNASKACDRLDFRRFGEIILLENGFRFNFFMQCVQSHSEWKAAQLLTHRSPPHPS